MFWHQQFQVRDWDFNINFHTWEKEKHLVEKNGEGCLKQYLQTNIYEDN